VELNVISTITPDKLHVILNIAAELQDFLGFQKSEYQTISGGEVVTVQQTLPQTERSRIRTRVSVPDCGTLLLGGMKLTAETEREAGVPVLSKLPIVGMAFSNRSKIKDSKVLLILVKPTIILQEEKDAEALDRMENIY
jgi:general secretion pathway protein D